MICFLTSRMDAPETGELNSANQFVDELRRHFPNPCRALDVCSDPDDREKMDYYASVTKNMLEASGFAFERFAVLDGRNEAQAEELVRGSNLLILSGGHVPTQNAFFQKIGLRRLLQDFNGVVIGISAGSMNSADVVYAQPEEAGEAVDPAYQRFLTGLNLTKINLLPHYQDVKDDVLDGLRVFADITCPDSVGRTFYAIPDGSYLYLDAGKAELRGEAYRVRDGVIRQISSHGEVVAL
jgi:dipeptidase E